MRASGLRTLRGRCIDIGACLRLIIEEADGEIESRPDALRALRPSRRLELGAVSRPFETANERVERGTRSRHRDDKILRRQPFHPPADEGPSQHVAEKIPYGVPFREVP